jgi:hypothetical protein
MSNTALRYMYGLGVAALAASWATPGVQVTETVLGALLLIVGSFRSREGEHE